MDCHFLLQGILPTPEPNPSLLCLLHWPAGSLSLVPHGKPSASLMLAKNPLITASHKTESRVRMRRSHNITQMQGKVKNWGIDTIIYHTTLGGFAYRMAANIMPQSWATEDSAAASDEHLMPKLHWEAFWHKTRGIAAAGAFPLSWVLLPQLVLLTKNEFSSSRFPLHHKLLMIQSTLWENFISRAYDMCTWLSSQERMGK